LTASCIWYTLIMDIHFTKHAEEKFDVLSKHGVKISKKKVIETVENPDTVDYKRHPLLIAQSSLGKYRVLRVVYENKKNYIIIITFYPGKKSQYEKK